MQGLEGPGWTPGPRADQRPWQVGILSWTFCCTTDIFIVVAVVLVLSPQFLSIYLFLVLAENGMTSCQSTDPLVLLAAATGDAGLSK